VEKAKQRLKDPNTHPIVKQIVNKETIEDEEIDKLDFTGGGAFG
jgi:hypothetical protein